MAKKAVTKSSEEARFERQLAWEHLTRFDKVSDKTLMAKVGLSYEEEIKQKESEIQDRKRIAHLLQSPYSPAKQN